MQLPPRFSLIDNHWPWRHCLPHIHLVSSRFDHRPLSDHDFADHHIPLPPNLNKAAPKRRAEFLAGRLCARRALWLLAGKENVPSIGPDRAPLWPNGVVGSITHSDSWAAALVAHQHDYLALGLDIEPCLTHSASQNLASTLLTPPELARASRLSPEQFAQLITLTFSLKESLFKALYPLVKKRFYFAEAELLSWSIATGTARLRLFSTLNEQWPAGQILEGYFCQRDKHVMTLVAVPHLTIEVHQ